MIWNINEKLTNNVVSFEQLGPGIEFSFIIDPPGVFLYASLKNGRIMLYPSASIHL